MSLKKCHYVRIYTQKYFTVIFKVFNNFTYNNYLLQLAENLKTNGSE